MSVDGIVQGVGFRPFVRGSAASLHLQGFDFVYRHHLVPANDGGLSLGQLAVAASRDSVPQRTFSAATQGAT